MQDNTATLTGRQKKASKSAARLRDGVMKRGNTW
jgi:hypothetical protein